MRSGGNRRFRGAPSVMKRGPSTTAWLSISVQRSEEGCSRGAPTRQARGVRRGPVSLDLPCASLRDAHASREGSARSEACASASPRPASGPSGSPSPRSARHARPLRGCAAARSSPVGGAERQAAARMGRRLSFSRAVERTVTMATPRARPWSADSPLHCGLLSTLYSLSRVPRALRRCSRPYASDRIAHSVACRGPARRSAVATGIHASLRTPDRPSVRHRFPEPSDAACAEAIDAVGQPPHRGDPRRVERKSHDPLGHPAQEQPGVVAGSAGQLARGSDGSRRRGRLRRRRS
jgi:hypothetical protein